MLWNKKTYIILFIVAAILLLFGFYIFNRYKTPQEATLDVTEFNQSEYPDNPATLDKNHGIYSHKKLVLTRNDPTHFTFTFLPSNEKSSTIILKNIDVSLMTPGFPSWIKRDPNLIRIALTDRQWNRQQVFF